MLPSLTLFLFFPWIFSLLLVFNNLLFVSWCSFLQLPRRLSAKESAYQCRRWKRCGFNPWCGKIPWRRAWQPTPVFLPGEFHGQRSLAGRSPWGVQRVGNNGARMHTQRIKPKDRVCGQGCQGELYSQGWWTCGDLGRALHLARTFLNPSHSLPYTALPPGSSLGIIFINHPRSSE